MTDLPPLSAYSDAEIASEFGRRRVAKRKNHNGGPKPKARSCPHCPAVVLGLDGMRAHIATHNIRRGRPRKD